MTKSEFEKDVEILTFGHPLECECCGERTELMGWNELGQWVCSKCV